jgi:uncharacterized protein (DUF1800 family)
LHSVFISITRPAFGTALAMVCAGALHAADFNGDGLCDVWQARYHAFGLLPADDVDGDGFSALEESHAGTDPTDANSRPTSGFIKRENDLLRIEATVQPGKSYQLLHSPTLNGPWTPVGEAHRAGTSTHTADIPQEAPHGFYRFGVSDRDSDDDGLSDWAERQLEGFDPDNADSFATGQSNGDAVVATAQFAALASGAITTTVTVPAAHEKEGTPAIVTFAREAAVAQPLTLFLRVARDPDSRRSFPGTEEYALRDEAGELVTHRIVIPAGAATAELRIHPVADLLPEVPETLRIHLPIGPAPVAVSIRDAAPVAENQRLFLAYLRPLPGVSSAGSGVATILLPGDNDTATIAVSFSNLVSPVNSVQVQTPDNAILQSVPPFAYNGQSWPVRANQSFATDQAVLDALLSGAIELSVFTEAHVAGEIDGQFLAATGSIDMPEPPPPPPVESLANFELDRDIVRFLTQATFGPTTADIADLRARVAAADGDRITAFSQWIDDQFAAPNPSLLAYTRAADRQEIEIRADPAKSYYNPTFDPSHNNRRRGWWLLARHSPSQLRQRAAFALSQIFVISDDDTLIRTRPYGSAHYHDMLASRSTGPFRDLLREVALHPMMGHYLSHLRNSKATFDAQGNIIVSPDENFAREIMQLFSIGLVQLHSDGSLKLGPGGLPVPTYNQDDITELARVFTGWSFSVYNNPSGSDNVVANELFSRSNGNIRFEDRWMQPMKNFPAFHDDGAKTLLGHELPAGQSANDELDDVIDLLADHPNTGPFIARRLIQRFVAANPSAGYLHRVSTAFSSSGGNLGTTLKAILLDPEARSPSAAESTASTGKPREPLLRYTAYARALGAKSDLRLADLTTYGYPAAELALFPPGTTRFRMSSTESQLSQTPLSAPSVFNWFLPDHTPAGILATNGLASPELQLANENSVVQATNYLYGDIFNTSSGIPTGNGNASNLPNQTEEPWSYGTNAHRIISDFTALRALYDSVVDVNDDGIFDNRDTGAFNNPDMLREACRVVLDEVDLLLCAGSLRARYGDTPGQPRRVILDAALSIRSHNNTSNTTQASIRDDRVRNILWFVMSTPDAIIQK